MAARYQEIMFTPSVRAAQHRFYGRAAAPLPTGTDDPLTPDAIEFIRARDSFYLGTVSPTGWPYIQHRGGAPGFLHVLDERRLAFADYKGNRQMISTGHLAEDARVSLFLMDYAARERLKILGRARVISAREDPELAAALADPAERRVTERLFVIDVVSFDWNCPQYITPRFTAQEVDAAVSGLHQRIRQLETELGAARKNPAIFRMMRERDAFGRTSENHAMVANNRSSTQCGKADLAFFALTRMTITHTRCVIVIERDFTTLCRCFA